MTGKQLKNSILQLAIQGKLVPQNPADEPASALLQRIRKEKEQLVKEKKLKKKDLVTTPISDEEKPFEIPGNWEWCRLGEIFLHTSGKQQSSSNKKEGKLHKFITTSNLYWGRFDLDVVKEMTFTEEEVKTCSATKGDLLVCEGGAGYGRSAIWPYDYDICLQNHVHRLRPLVNGTCEYVYHFIYLLKETNQLQSVGTAMPGLSANRLKGLVLPLPPLAEQHSIVAKIEELMPLVEEYDKAQTKLDDLNRKLPEALKKSILQEAIMGKLVAQDPNDEPASVLLQRIRAEKEQLVKEGKLKKKDLVTTPITDEEKPFEIPESWEWCRLGEISTFNGGYAFKSINYVESNQGMRVLRISDFSEEGISDKAPVYHPKDQKLEKFKLEENDIIMCMTGGTVGKSCHIKNLSEDFYVNQRIADLKINPCVYSDYIYKVIASSYIQSIINESKNSTNDNISAQLINDFLIPLPPLSEQHRIVAKIEELFGVLG